MRQTTKPFNSSISATKTQTKLSHVRIIGGKYRRRLVSFVEADGLRPTPDRVRETVFNWLDFELPNTRVLDCCAGSGVLGFEALSRGASHATLIEPNRAQFSQLVRTQTDLAIEPHHIRLFNQTAQDALTTLVDEPPFDVVFLDPPYSLALWDTLLTLLLQQALITDETLLYIEADHPIDAALPKYYANLHCYKHKKMGQVYAGLFRYESL